MLSVIEVVKISDSRHELVLNSPCKLTADPGCFRKKTAEIIIGIAPAIQIKYYYKPNM